MIKTTAQTITLRGRIPSKKNSKRIARIQRGPQRGRTVLVSSRNHNIWHHSAQIELLEQKARPMTGQLSVAMKFWFPDNRRSDLTNKAESVMDLLVDVGIIEDDNVAVCPKVSLEFMGVDRQNPRVEVELIKIEP